MASWLNDGNGTGFCLVDFDSEDHARGAVEALAPGARVGVYAVEFEASG